jgi:flagellin FlaB
MRWASVDDAITGLEAAIVLIAFVVVGAVFSHVIISAGMTLSDGTRTEVHKGMSRAGSGLVTAGSIYAVDLNDDLRDAEGILVPIRLLSGSDPVDLRMATINLIGRNAYETIAPNDPLYTSLPTYHYFSISSPAPSDQDPVLSPGDRVTLFIRPMYKANCKAGHSPVIEIIAPGMHPLRIPLSFPASLTPYTRLS